MRKVILAAALLPLVAGGCVRTVAGVVTAPVRLAGKAVSGTADMMTTSSKERDAKWVRAQRKREEAQRKACKKDKSQCHEPEVAGR